MYHKYHSILRPLAANSTSPTFSIHFRTGTFIDTYFCFAWNIVVVCAPSHKPPRMMNRIVALVALFGTSQAMDASSRAGQELLSKSRLLAENKNDRDISWMPYYSIKFEKCHSLIQVAGQGNGGGGGNNNNNQNRGMLYNQHLVEFSLCPSDSCSSSSSCKNGAKYIANMREFAQLYTEYKQEALEKACETIRQNCYSDDDTSCYTQAGMTECIEVEGQEQVDLEKYMECQVLENNNNKNNNNNQNYNYGYYVSIGMPAFSLCYLVLLC